MLDRAYRGAAERFVRHQFGLPESFRISRQARRLNIPFGGASQKAERFRRLAQLSLRTKVSKTRFVSPGTSLLDRERGQAGPTAIGSALPATMPRFAPVR